MQLSVTRCLSLDAALTMGGRIVSLKDTLTGTVTGYTVYHHVTDHLGSVRAVVYAGGTAPSAQAGISPGTVVETSDYLPFGTRWTQTGGSAAGTLTDATNRWRYSGKEEQSSIDECIPLIDYGARMYDPAIARWMSADPMAEKYYPLSPYSYCAGNPVIVVDPNGQVIFVREFAEGNTILEYEWKEIDGAWGFYDKGNNAYSGTDEYILSVSSALSSLMEGDFGSDLVKAVAERKERVGIMKSSINFYQKDDFSIGWSENKGRHSFVSLGHELAHAIDHLRGTVNYGIWIEAGSINMSPKPEPPNDITYSEIFAIHYENMIRKEHKLSLRDGYLSYNENSYAPPYVLDNYGRSLYFNKSGSTNYKIVKPKDRFVYK